MRRTAVLAALGTTLLSLQALAVTPPKSGSVCPKSGITQNFQGKKFTCIKSGKKLVWDKGVVIKVAAPSLSPSPATSTVPSPSSAPSLNPSPTPLPTSAPSPSNATNPTPSPSATPTPSIETFVPPTIPNSFAELEIYVAGIPYGAWLKSKQVIESSKSKLSEVKIFNGPNSSSIDLTPFLSLTDVSRMFPSMAEPQVNYVFVYSLSDIAWANQKIEELIGSEELRQLQRNENNQLVEGNCPSQCTNAKQQTSRASMKSLILLGADYFKGISGNPCCKFDGKGLLNHEYMHALQRIPLMTSTANNGNVEWPPSWFSEGSATFVANAAQNYTSYDDYLTYRKIQWNRIGRPLLDEPWFLDYLDEKYLKSRWTTYNYVGMYEVGMRISEILVALKGPESLMEIYKELGRGSSFLAAFEKVYGTKWSEARPYIARALLLQSGT